MPFIPRLPTWNTEVEVLQFDPDTETWATVGTLTGQLYHPHRGQPGTMFGDLYLVYPKEDNIIADPREYGKDPWIEEPPYGDIVQFTWPTEDGSVFQYWVLQVHPRWLGFPNEHLCARLRMVVAGTELPETPVDPSSWTGPTAPVFLDDSCSDCEELDVTLELELEEPEIPRYTSEPFDFTCDPLTQYYWQLIYEAAGGTQLALTQVTGGAVVCRWDASRIGWNGTDPLSFTLTFAVPDYCVWPDPLVLTPAP